MNFVIKYINMLYLCVTLVMGLMPIFTIDVFSSTISYVEISIFLSHDFILYQHNAFDNQSDIYVFLLYNL